MFEKLRLKINAHHSSHPLAKPRAEFLAVDSNTPLEKKSHFTSEVVGSAAAFEAFRAFENHSKDAQGGKVTHARAKEIIVGIATGYVVKLVEEKKLPFTSESDKARFIKNAQISATRDAKRAVRESGMYEPAELESMDADEKHGVKI